MSISSFFLVIYDVQKKATRDAGYIYFIFTQAGALFIFAGFGFLYAHTGTFGFDAIGSIPDSAKLIAFILILIGCGSKAGIMPLHVWLPYAHPAAPSHVSAVMSGVMATSFCSNMLPSSTRSLINIVVTPVSVSPLIMAQLIGAAPR